MTLFVASLLLLSGVALGRFFVRPKKQTDSLPLGEGNSSKNSGNSAESTNALAISDSPLGPRGGRFPLHLGDVVVRKDGDERWLAGCLCFQEQIAVAVLFIAPEKGADRAVYVRPAPVREIWWLDWLDPKALKIGSEPPHVIEFAGTLFERVRRLPVLVERLGENVPSIGTSAILAEYNGGRKKMLVVAGNKECIVVVGDAIEPESYDVLTRSVT